MDKPEFIQPTEWSGYNRICHTALQVISHQQRDDLPLPSVKSYSIAGCRNL
jgi:hypothetical protein